MKLDIFKPVESNYDDVARECFKINKNSCFSFWLASSYAYYIQNESIMSDVAFDKLSKWMLDNYDDLTHTNKHLVTKEMLRAGSGYNLKEEDYPIRVKVTADMFIRGLYVGKHC